MASENNDNVNAMFDAFGNVGTNVVSTAANSLIGGAISSHYNKDSMDYADRINRNFTKDQYGLMVEGMLKAGLNPAVAMSGASPAQAAHGLATGPASPGVQGNAAQSRMADAQEQSVQSQTNLNAALARKAQAEADAIDAKTPGEVSKMTVEMDKMRGEIELNNAIRDNTVLSHALIQKDIDLTSAHIVTEGVKRGLMKSESAKNYSEVARNAAETGRVKLVAKGLEIDLGYSADKADVYETVKHGLAEKLGIPESAVGAAAQGIMKMLGFGAKVAGGKAVAKNITQNSEHVHYHTYKGDKYTVNGSIHRGS